MAAEAAPSTRRIDVHSHFTTPRYVDKLEKLGGYEKLEMLKPFGVLAKYLAMTWFPDGEQDFVDRQIAEMDRAGVDLMVFGMGSFQPYFEEAAPAIEAARFANDCLADAVGMGGGRLAAFGSLPLPHADSAAAEVAYCLDELGFAGVNLGCSAAGLPLDHASLDDVWAALDERSATVYIHPGTTPQMGVGSADWGLSMSFVSPTELALALSRLILGKVTTKYPNVRIVSAVLGGAVPFFATRLAEHVRLAAGDLYDELDGVVPHFRKMWFDTGYEDPYAFDAIRRTIGVDRLVLGSDTPRMTSQDAVAMIASSELLSAEEKTAILDENGMTALGMLTEKLT